MSMVTACGSNDDNHAYVDIELGRTPTHFVNGNQVAVIADVKLKEPTVVQYGGGWTRSVQAERLSYNGEIHGTVVRVDLLHPANVFVVGREEVKLNFANDALAKVKCARIEVRDQSNSYSIANLQSASLDRLSAGTGKVVLINSTNRK